MKSILKRLTLVLSVVTALALIICLGAIGVSATGTDTHDHTALTAWSATNGTVTDGSYYLADNVTASDIITISGTVTLCLGGKTLDIQNFRITVSEGSSFVISDCGTEGNITGISSAISNLGSLTLNSGSIITTDEHYLSYSISTNPSENNITVINGGKVQACADAINQYGGNVYINGGEVISTTSGYPINTQEGELHITGGTISSSYKAAVQLAHTEYSDSTLYLSGTPTFRTPEGIENVELYTSNHIIPSVYLYTKGDNSDRFKGYVTISPNMIGDGLPMVKDVEFDDFAHFKVINASVTVAFGTGDDANNAVMHYHSFEGDSCSCGAHKHDDITFEPWYPTKTAPAEDGNWCLMNNVDNGAYVHSGLKFNMNICLNDKTIDLGVYSMKIFSEQTMNIFDCGENGLITSSCASDNKTIFYAISIDDGGTLVLNNGTIQNSNNSEIYYDGITNGYGTLIINGGTVRGGTAITAFGQLEVNGGNIIGEGQYGIEAPDNGRLGGCTLEINGGTIQGELQALHLREADLYLSGEPEIITVSETEPDIFLWHISYIYAHAIDNVDAQYTGEKLSIHYDRISGSHESRPVVYDVKPENSGRYEIFDHPDYILAYGYGENTDDLIFRFTFPGSGTEDNPYLASTSRDIMLAMLGKESGDVIHIKLLNDIIVDNSNNSISHSYTFKPLVLDLDGKTISYELTGYYSIGGEATVKNGTIKSTGLNHVIKINGQTADVTLENLTIITDTAANAVIDHKQGKLTVNNCTISATNESAYAISIERSGLAPTVELNDLKMTAPAGIICMYNSYGSTNNATVTLDGAAVTETITDKTYHTHGDNNADCYCDIGGELVAHLGTATKLVYNNDGTHNVLYTCCGDVHTANVSCMAVSDNDCLTPDLCACGNTVTVAGHKGGTASCTAKAKCDVCGAEYGELTAHSFGDDNVCDTCGYKKPSEGLHPAAIAGIAVGAVLVLGGGGFALFWFVIRKKKA